MEMETIGIDVNPPPPQEFSANPQPRTLGQLWMQRLGISMDQ